MPGSKVAGKATQITSQFEVNLLELLCQLRSQHQLCLKVHRPVWTMGLLLPYQPLHLLPLRNYLRRNLCHPNRNLPLRLLPCSHLVVLRQKELCLHRPLQLRQDCQINNSINGHVPSRLHVL